MLTKLLLRPTLGTLFITALFMMGCEGKKEAPPSRSKPAQLSFTGSWMKSEAWMDEQKLDADPAERILLNLGAESFETDHMRPQQGPCTSGGPLRYTDTTLILTIVQSTCRTIKKREEYTFFYTLEENGQKLQLTTDLDGQQYREIYLR
jgi:hypothetical protein